MSGPAAFVAAGAGHDRRRRGLAPLLLGMLFLLTAGAVCAQPAHETLFFDGLARRAYARGDYGEALRYFLLARDTATGAGVTYNIAVSADLAGQRELAYTSLVDYLAFGEGDPVRRRDATQRLERLRQELTLVRVESEPPGAEVFVDRRDLGAFGRTPRDVPVLPGERLLEVALDGYHPAHVPLTAVRGDRTVVRVQLEPEEGLLVVHASPVPIALTLDGGDGRRAVLRPDVVARLPVGHYRLTAAAVGRVPLVRRVTVVEGERVELSLALDRIPVPMGALLVASGRVRASVYVDGRRVAVTPARVADLPAGEHRLELRAPGYQPWAETVIVEEGRTLTVNATPHPTAGARRRGRRASAPE